MDNILLSVSYVGNGQFQVIHWELNWIRLLEIIGREFAEIDVIEKYL